MKPLHALAIAAAIPLAATTALADPPRIVPGPVLARVVSVYDGDTFRVDAYPLPRHIVQFAVRLRGADTPELRGECEAEKARAEAAREFTAARLGATVRLYNLEDDKYAGRFVADVTTESGEDLAQLLIASGHARAYGGGARQAWCD